jgi:hypothetical protein
MEKVKVLKSGVEVRINETPIKGVFVIEFYKNGKMIDSGRYSEREAPQSGESLKNISAEDIDELNDWIKRNSQIL